MTDLIDLRGAFAAPASWAPPDEEPPPAEPDPSPDDDGTAEPINGLAGEGEGQGSGDGEPPANPELKKLHDEAARHRVRAKDAEAKVESLTEQVRTLTLRLAFNDLAGRPTSQTSTPRGSSRPTTSEQWRLARTGRWTPSASVRSCSTSPTGTPT